MENYKVLLTGNNRMVIDDIFRQLDEKYLLMFTSQRVTDMVNHIRVVQPQFFVICLSGETQEHWEKYSGMRELIQKMDVCVIVAGPKECCDAFQKNTGYMASMVVNRPLTAAKIDGTIRQYIGSYQKVQSQNGDTANGLHAAFGGTAPAPENTASDKKHILVVEDDPLMLKMIKEHLHDTYEVATAISGKVALKFLQSKHTDLILLDYEMPEMNGEEVLKQVRQNPQTENIPVLFLTGVTDKTKIVKVLSHKPQGYLVKPVDREKLLEAIKGVI